MTPFVRSGGTKPNVEHLRILGGAAYAHIAKEKRQKLDSKAKICILWDCGNKT